MENAPTMSTPEGKEVNPIEHIFRTDIETGAAIVKIDEIENSFRVSLSAPIPVSFKGGNSVEVTEPDGTKKRVLETALFGLSEKGTEGVALTHVQLDADEIKQLLTLAKANGIIESEYVESLANSKWAQGGKMDQMLKFAQRVEKEEPLNRPSNQ
jgi:hypothetical protein